MKIREFINEMDRLYPRNLAAEWDMDGLQCSADPEKDIRRVLVALDATADTIGAAIEGDYDLLITHHPMIFGKAGDIVPERLYGNRIIKLITAGVSAASFHTRFDAGVGGVNDSLASVLGFSETETFGDTEMPDGGRIGVLAAPMSVEEFCALVKEKLHAPSVKLTGSGEVKRVAMLGGAGKDFVMPAKAAGADVIVTGEVSYNAALDFAEAGIAVIEAGHYYTEFPACHRLAELVKDITGAEAEVYAIEPQKTI